MRIFLTLIFSLHLLWAADATIDVIKDVNANPKIAVEGYSSNVLEQPLRDKLYKMVRADLKVAGFFNVSDASFPTGYEQRPSFLRYGESNVDFLVRFKVYEQEGRKGMEVRVMDVRSRELVFHRSYTVSKAERYPFLAHRFTVDFSQSRGLEALEWMDKFVIFARTIAPKETEIVISDYSLTFHQPIVKGGFNVFPKWENGEQQAFYYTAYLEKPTLFRVDLYTGEKTRVIESDGMLVCSDVREDGRKLLLTMAPDDQPDIYEYDRPSQKLLRLTGYKGIDVNGRYLEDGRKIAFVSDRFGAPEIFAKEMGKSGVEQMVFKGKNNNYVDTWKNYLVYVSRDSDSPFGPNTFNMYLISTESDFIRQLTTTGKNYFPRFASTGDTLLYIKQYENQSALGVLRLGYNKSFLFPLDAGQIQSLDW